MVVDEAGVTIHSPYVLLDRCVDGVGLMFPHQACEAHLGRYLVLAEGTQGYSLACMCLAVTFAMHRVEAHLTHTFLTIIAIHFRKLVTIQTLY